MKIIVSLVRTCSYMDLYLYMYVLAIASHPARVLRYRRRDKRWELVASVVGLGSAFISVVIYYPLPDSLLVSPTQVVY